LLALQGKDPERLVAAPDRPMTSFECMMTNDYQHSDQELSMMKRSKGLAEASALCLKPWCFRLEDIHTKVYAWHGEEPVNAPFAAHRKVLAQKLPNAVVQFYPGEGHISLIHKHLKTILETLAVGH
jgi:hypothetical protein